jgi:hypothetical protein
VRPRPARFCQPALQPLIVVSALKRQCGDCFAGYREEEEARQYLCDQAATATAGTHPDHYAVIFTFRIDGGGTLGLLWNREGGRWKIVSYQPLVPYSVTDDDTFAGIRPSDAPAGRRISEAVRS